MDAPSLLIKHFHSPKSLAIVLEHSRLVADLAISLAQGVQHLKPDLQFIEEAALLHDIGVSQTDSPQLDCHGTHHYLCHGILGAEMLCHEGYSRHAAVCERHIGIGLTAAEIRAQALPLPPRDMVPETVEEQIICFADLFYSKQLMQLSRRKTAGEVRSILARLGDEKPAVFDSWCRIFSFSEQL